MNNLNNAVNKHAWKRFDECDKANNLKRRAFWHNVAMHTSGFPPTLRKQAV